MLFIAHGNQDLPKYPGVKLLPPVVLPLRGKRKGSLVPCRMVAQSLAVVSFLCFSTGFYWFFIRPYALSLEALLWLKGYGVCMPCNYEVHGIDISHYQGKID